MINIINSGYQKLENDITKLENYGKSFFYKEKFTKQMNKKLESLDKIDFLTTVF